MPCSRYFAVLRHGMSCLLLLCTFAQQAQAADAPLPSERALWARTMGQSGLRRFYSTGADLGELINRQVSYQIASRVDTAVRIRNPAAAPPAPGSDVEGIVAQYDSLIGVNGVTERPFYLRTLARSAKRLEADKVHSRNDRYDLGALYAPSARSYIGLGLGLEQTRVDLKFTTGTTRLDAWGPRVDAGLAMKPWLAFGLRAEDLHFSGDNAVSLRTASGTTRVTRELDYHRRYLQLESIVRLTRAQLSLLPPGWQAGGMAALHYLDTRYSAQRSSLGQVVTEPFGNKERLGILRTGLFLQGAGGANGAWNPYAELLFDRELDTNLNHPLSTRNSVQLRTGLARTMGQGRRLSVEYQHSESTNELRERDNLILLLVYDF
jgi:hypothetical protein